jgi:hypothetical protein
MGIEELEELKRRIEAMTPEQKRELAMSLVSRVNAMAFDIVAHDRIAKSQGRSMISEQELSTIVLDQPTSH